ncbi:MAG: hypothetical protein V3S46_06750 [Nitrospinota bacterium]
MNEYIVFQLFIDILLFAIIIAYVVKDGGKAQKKEMPDIEELRDLVEEFQSAVDKSERTARDLDDQLRARRDALEALKVIKPTGRMEENRPEAAAQTNPATNMSTDERKRRIKLLRQQGVSKEEIANQLSVPLSEVELILKMAGGVD